jgi:hypothetical protein
LLVDCWWIAGGLFTGMTQADKVGGETSKGAAKEQ